MAVPSAVDLTRPELSAGRPTAHGVTEPANCVLGVASDLYGTTVSGRLSRVGDFYGCRPVLLTAPLGYWLFTGLAQGRLQRLLLRISGGRPHRRLGAIAFGGAFGAYLTGYVVCCAD